MAATNPSEHRLHPVALFLFVGGQLKEIAFAALAWFVATRAGESEIALLGPVIVGAIAGTIVLVPSITKLLTYRYSHGEGELVLRWGLLFRRERHIPYERIQNLDARETLLHRLTGTVKIVVETGGGAGESEASIEAVPRAALALMRERVLGAGHRADAGVGVVVGETLVTLGPRELILTGLILNRGMIVVGGLLAFAAELGFGDRLLEGWLGEDLSGQGTVRTLFELLSGARWLAFGEVMLAIGGVLLFLVLVRIFSMALTMIRYHAHRLELVGDDLRVSYGLFTRIHGTTPRRRIQTVVVREGPWHRMAGRVTIQVITAGLATEGGTGTREMLAPLVRREAVPGLLAVISPGAQAGEATWQRAARPASLRAIRRHLLVAGPLLMGAALAGIPALLLGGVVAGLMLTASLARIRRFGWQVADDLLVLRTGWLWRRTTLVRHDRVQGVVTSTSPFDRRHNMQEVQVDTAGTSASLDLPHLWRAEAERLAVRLHAGAARTAYRV